MATKKTVLSAFAANASTVSKATKKAISTEVVQFEIAKIVVLPQTRTNFDEEKLEELICGIRAKGVKIPVGLNHVNGQYQLIYGERRLRACKALNMTHIPAIVQENMSPTEVFEFQYHENIHERLDAYDEANAVMEYVKLVGVDGYMAIQGKSRSWVSKRCAVKDFPEEVKTLLKDGINTDLEYLISLAQLAKNDPEKYIALIAKIKNGEAVKRETVRDLASSAKPAKPKSKDPKPPKASLDELIESTRINGKSNFNYCQNIKAHLQLSKAGPEKAQAILKQAFLSSALPALAGAGDDVALQLAQDLVDELRNAKAHDLWKKYRGVSEVLERRNDKSSL